MEKKVKKMKPFLSDVKKYNGRLKMEDLLMKLEN